MVVFIVTLIKLIIKQTKSITSWILDRILQNKLFESSKPSVYFKWWKWCKITMTLKWYFKVACSICSDICCLKLNTAYKDGGSRGTGFWSASTLYIQIDKTFAKRFKLRLQYVKVVVFNFLQVAYSNVEQFALGLPTPILTNSLAFRTITNRQLS